MIILRQIDYSSKKKEDVDKNRAKAAGVGGIGVGLGLLATTKKSHLTGREVRWHSTDKSNIKSIKEGGIKSKFAADPNNITNKIVKDVPISEKEGLVYLAKKKNLANAVGRTRDTFAQGKAGKSKTLKVVFDYDELKKRKKVANPELRGFDKKGWGKYRLSILKEDLPNIGEKLKEGGLVEKLTKIVSDIEYNNLGPKGTDVLKGDVSAKNIKGSKYFEKNSAKKIANYIKNNPKRFTKQAVKGAVGIAAVGYGVKKLYDANKKKEKDV